MSTRAFLLPVALAFVLPACGGARLVKNAPPLPQREQPLASAGDAAMAARLDHVVVRNGPGSWARNAVWDEYLIRVHNSSSEPVEITSVTVTDSLGHVATPLNGRRALVVASEETEERYDEMGVEVQAGRTSAALMAMGVGAYGAGAGLAAVALAGGGSAYAAGALAGVLAGPALLGAGIVRGVQSHKVTNRIKERATTLPLTVAANADAGLDLFYPISPSPRTVRITYRNAQGERQLAIDTTQVLNGLHLPAPDVASASP